MINHNDMITRDNKDDVIISIKSAEYSISCFSISYNFFYNSLDALQQKSFLT